MVGKRVITGDGTGNGPHSCFTALRKEKYHPNKQATLAALPPSSIIYILYGWSPKLLTIKMICDGLDITLSKFFVTKEYYSLEPELE